ncbi:MAG: serine/threonine protein kinase [Planctomycetes bacterium]|nr:serine/threonine protein kinase [Planctomycetota bacterium]
MAVNSNDLAFARLLVELEISSLEVVKANLNELEMQKKQGESNLNLGVMMYRKNLITDEDLRKIKRRHKERIQQTKKTKHEPQPRATPHVQKTKHDVDDSLINKQFGSYIIRRLLGTGGMGKVYLGENPLLNKFAAIKVLSYQYAKDEHYLKRFYREAKMAAAIQHPNIVQVYDFGQEHGLNYLVMEYVDGETLEDKIKREKKLSITEAIRIHMDVLKGMKTAHSQEIIHRDIKPENIMITKNNEVKLTDMGLARHKDPTQSEALTIEGQALGTPRFMAPEQALGEAIDSRTDFYALGVSLYHSICGEFPYPGKKPVEILRNMLRNVPIPLKIHLPSVPDYVNRIVMKLISKSKIHRFSTADNTLHALEKCIQAIESPKEITEFRGADVAEFDAIQEVPKPKKKSGRKAPLPPSIRSVAEVKPEKVKSSNLLLIIVIIVLFILLVAAGFVIYMLAIQKPGQAYENSNNKKTYAIHENVLTTSIEQDLITQDTR